MLCGIERTQPIDQYVGSELREHVVSQHGIGPVHLSDVVVVRRRRPEPLENDVAHVLWVSRGRPAFEETVNRDPGTASRGWVEQEAIASRSRTGGYQLASIALKDFGQRLDRGSTTGHFFETKYLPIVTGVERCRGVDAGNEHAVADDSVQDGIRAGGEGRCVDSCDRRKNRITVY